MQAYRPKALPWVRGALRRLARHGVRLGLVTASTRSVVEPTIERLNLEGVFETTYFADDVAHGKPHPEALLRALGDLGVAAGDSVYVGDTTVDLGWPSRPAPRSRPSPGRRARRPSGGPGWTGCGRAWAPGPTTCSARPGPGSVMGGGPPPIWRARRRARVLRRARGGPGRFPAAWSTARPQPARRSTSWPRDPRARTSRASAARRGGAGLEGTVRRSQTAMRSFVPPASRASLALSGDPVRALRCSSSRPRARALAAPIAIVAATGGRAGGQRRRCPARAPRPRGRLAPAGDARARRRCTSPPRPGDPDRGPVAVDGVEARPVVPGGPRACSHEHREDARSLARRALARPRHDRRRLGSDDVTAALARPRPAGDPRASGPTRAGDRPRCPPPHRAREQAPRRGPRPAPPGTRAAAPRAAARRRTRSSGTRSRLVRLVEAPELGRDRASVAACGPRS